MLRIESLARLLSTRSLHIYLSPQQVCAVVRQRRGILAGSARQMPVTGDHGQAAWQPAVDALNALLRLHAAAWAGLPLHIALAGRWSQLALAPWSDALLSAPSAAGFLQPQLLAVYGDAALGWRISADDAPYGQARLACGADELLLQALEATAAEHGHPCRAIEPILGAALSMPDALNKRHAPGSAGTPGAPGASGVPGVPGTIGTIGATGASGSPGAPAIPGAPGLQGVLGMPGTPGISHRLGAGRASSSAAPQALIVAEAGRLTMAALQHGRVSALQIQPAGPAWPQELPLAWQRWTLRAPELAALERVTVLPLCAGAAQADLPARFQLSAHPYGADAPSSSSSAPAPAPASTSTPAPSREAAA